MIKKICILIFVTIIISSCGKKGDPEYKKSGKNNVFLRKTHQISEKHNSLKDVKIDLELSFIHKIKCPIVIYL